MKKVFLVIFVLIALCSIAYAYEIDFSEYSDSDLLELETMLQAEKIARGLVKSATVYPGEYTIGKDIPAGVYSIETTTGAADHLYIYNSSGKQIGSYAIGTSSDRSPIGRIELLDGYIIKFDSCTLKFAVYTGGIVFE